jgi:hypothetical protein
MSGLTNWDGDGVMREARAEARRRLERAAWIVERKAKALLAVEGTMSVADVQDRAARDAEFTKSFNRNVAFVRGSKGKEHVRLKAGQVTPYRKKARP